jgi:hypothetical protein
LDCAAVSTHAVGQQAALAFSRSLFSEQQSPLGLLIMCRKKELEAQLMSVDRWNLLFGDTDGI